MSKRWILVSAVTGIALLGLWTWAGEWGSRSGLMPPRPMKTLADSSQYAEEAATSTDLSAKPENNKLRPRSRFAVTGGTVRFDFDSVALEPLNLRFVARGAVEETADRRRVSFGIKSSSTLQIEAPRGAIGKIVTGEMHTSGALLLDKPGDRVVIGNLAIGVSDDGHYTVRNTLTEDDAGEIAFEMTSVMVDFVPATQELFMTAGLSVTSSWASAIDLPKAAEVEIGTLQIDATLTPIDRVVPPADGPACDEGSRATDQTTGTIGSDVVVADLQSIKYYGRVGDIHAYAVGTYACNFGDQRANWIQQTNQHPVIVQNMYRLKDDRFEQIGMSWVKHGFYAVSWDFCQLGCPDPTDGTALGVGCADPYSASLNGVQSNMSRRSDVNAFTGFFPYPWTAPEPEPIIGKRLQVHEADLDPNLNPDAMYFIQGHYVHPNDSVAGTADNNASYRPVEVTACTLENCPVTCLGDCEHGLVVAQVGNTQRRQPAIRAWQDTDPAVVETDIRVPGEGLFIVAAKAIELETTGTWRYEYAVQNLNSDRSARSFSIPLPNDAVVTDIGFHDVDYHSGEIYDLTDWPWTVENGAITWATDTYDVNPNANALRFSTLYSFYFQANVEPATTTATIDLFKPGLPTEIIGVTIGPKLALIDCNLNSIADRCDIDCAADGCEWPCGGSIDCNGNGVPDECERDCDDNGIADACDIRDCAGATWCDDCNGNSVLDVCEVDCDGNGIPDDCVAPPDTDQDGINDCVDLCPLTTPPDSCVCPAYGDCCWGTYCLSDYAPLECIELLGVPECLATPCTNGCIIGDYDRDGDLDLYDFWALQTGFSGPIERPGFEPPPQEYWLVLDVDDDEDIDLDDYDSFEFFHCGPGAAPQYQCEPNP